MGYKAAIFDLDGTLLDTLEDLWLATNHALEAVCLPPRSIEEVRRFVGNGYRQLARLACSPDTPDELQEEMLAHFNTYYLAHDRVHTAPYPGVEAMLAELRSLGIRLAVVSNKGDAAVRDLVDHYFPHLFEAVAGEREGIKRKPAPDTVLSAMQLLHVEAEETLYIGDSEVDVATARNVGCDCLSVTWGFRTQDELREAGATCFASTADDVVHQML